MQYIEIKEILEKTDGGRYVIEKYYPDSAESFNKSAVRKFKARGNEKTASASLTKSSDGVWLVTDFGGDGKTRNAVGIVMMEENLDFPSALNHIAALFNIVPGAQVHTIAKPEINKRPAAAEEEEGYYYFEVKENFTLADSRNIIADNVWKHMVNNAGSNDTPIEKREAAALAKANEVFKRYNFYSLTAYTIIKNRYATEIRATDEFPIYMFDEKDWKKIYKPKEQDKKYRFTYYNKPKDLDKVMFGYRQAHKAYQELINIVDESIDDADDGKKKKKGPDKLSEVIICSGGSDGLNLAMLGYWPVWFNSESAKFNRGQYMLLASIAEKVYNVPDIDKTGKKAAYNLGMEHLDVYSIYLPEELKTHKDWRGNPCKDLRDYFKYYKPWDFKELFKIAYPYKFWDEVKEYNKAGEYTGMRYVPNNDYLRTFLADNGFYRFKIEGDKEGYIYIEVRNGIVKEVKPKDVRDFVNRFLWERRFEVKLRNAFYRTNQLNESSLSNLPYADIEFTDFNKETQWMFFQNKVFKITAECIEEIKPADCDRYVWHDEVVNHRVVKLAPFFTISQDIKTRAWDIEILKKDCMVLNYLINASRMFWREELERRLDGIETKDRAKYAELHGFKEADMLLLDGIKDKDEKEQYRIDNKFNIAGPLLTDAEKTEQKAHLVNKLFTLGFLLHRYKSMSKAWCNWAMDAKNTENSESHGGSGKSISLKLIAYLVRHEYIEGRNAKITDNPHIFGNITKHTDFLFIDDAGEYLKFDFFYPSITGPMNCNPKNTKIYTLPFDDVPKMGFASNFPPFGADHSAERRIVYTLFSDYYHGNTMGEYREERKVSDDFGGRELLTDFTEEDWNDFLNFMAQCVQFYLSCTTKINPPMNKVDKRNLKAKMGDAFQAWADVYFNKEGERLDKMIVKSEAFEAFRKETKLTQWSPNRFIKALRAWCFYNDIELNPKEYVNDEKNNRIVHNLKLKNEKGEELPATTYEMLFLKSPDALPHAEEESEEDLPF